MCVLTPCSMNFILILYKNTVHALQKTLKLVNAIREIECCLLWEPYKMLNYTVWAEHKMTPMVKTERHSVSNPQRWWQVCLCQCSVRNMFKVENNTCVFTSRMLKGSRLKDSVLLKCDTVTGSVVPNVPYYSTVQNHILDTECFFNLWSQHSNCATYRGCLRWHFIVHISAAVQITLFNTRVPKFWAPDSEVALHLVTLLLKT
jgi:hypothetical protein